MNADKERQAIERRKSAEYLVAHYTREQRYLIIYARDFRNYLQSAEWLQSADARQHCKLYDFLADYQGLRNKMAEFHWSKEKLSAAGIDFAAIKNLYHKVSASA